jgi:hypothetical protein
VPLDLTGVTLTSGADEGAWVSAVGNGAPLTRAIGVGSRTEAASARSDAPEAAPPRVVAVTDLSDAPVAPNLDRVLARHYPEDARRRGLAGQATVRIRIAPSGRVVAATPLGESAPGFADAGGRAVRGSVWSAPRDRRGRPVATDVKYVCRFRVEE